MSYKEINFMSRGQMMCTEGCGKTIVISISSPGDRDAVLKGGFKDILYLQFSNEEGWDSSFSQVQARQILDFTEKHEGEAERILVNCMVGESRSAAVAKFLADNYFIDMKRETPKYLPHVYELLEVAAFEREE